MNSYWAIIWFLLAAAHLLFCAFGGNVEPRAKRLGKGYTLSSVNKATVLRLITKPLLLPMLTLWYCAIADPVQGIIVAGLLLGFLGDVFLMVPTSPKLMLAGLTSFALGHVCYIIYALMGVSAQPWWIYLLLVFVYGALVLLLNPTVKKKLPKELGKAGFIYMILLCVLSAACVLYWRSGGGALAAIGAVLFIISDYLLVGYLFGKRQRYGNFFVMLTYCAAQLLIMLSFV
ncbi:lysoplasmalogenase [Eubacteriales bacterium OttesenSCG-928-K08]|nr:lysoplasmalogenase [Eubacteriales bacterium OttesenSCG-928-K08]